MSRPKKDRLFPTNSTRVTDAELAELVAAALRQDYEDLPSAVKQIGLRTGANLRAIKNWYEARHAPSSSHLLTLARSSPGILKLVLEQVGGSDLFDAFQLLGGQSSGQKIRPPYVPINVPIKTTQPILNERQSWFLGVLESEMQIRITDIVARYGVSLKTAKRDVAWLKSCNLILFIGARKTGRYQLAKKP